MLPKTGLSPVQELLYASKLCNMKPEGSPIHRLQLIFVANKELGAGVHQMTFQRALEDGVDKWGFWDNYKTRGSGEYILTRDGDKELECFYEGEDIEPLYTPQNKKGCSFSLMGNYNSYKIRYRIFQGEAEIIINGREITPASEACRMLRIGFTKGNETVNLYDFCIDNRFEMLWEGRL